MPKPYRPSNGTEGDIFMSHFCFRCERDAAYRAAPESGVPGCMIMGHVLAFDIDDPNYPKEWVYDEFGVFGGNGARCTAFVPEGEEIPYRCPETPDLFSCTQPNDRTKRDA